MNWHSKSSTVASDDEEKRQVEAYKEELSQYKNNLDSLEQKSQESYDKTLISLSSSALTISFALTQFLASRLPTLNDKLFLNLSWLCWSISLTLVLISFYMSVMHLRGSSRLLNNKIQDIKTLKECEELFKKATDDPSEKLLHRINIISGASFVAGIALFAYFIASNLK